MINYYTPPPKKTTIKRNGEPILEADVEGYWKRGCENRGWVSEKFKSPQKRSVPDQIITVPAGNFECIYPFVFWNELKRPGKNATPNQESDHNRRREAGCLVFCCDSYEQCDMAFQIVELILSDVVPVHFNDIPPYLLR